MTAMHVLFSVGVYPPKVGGIENHVVALAHQLRDQGHRVTVVVPVGPVGVRDEDGIRVHRLPSRLDIADVIHVPPVGTTASLSRWVRDQDVDVISTHTRFFPMSTVGSAVAARTGVPLLHTEHGSDHVRGVSPFVGLGSRAVDVTLGRRVLRRADGVLALSESVQAFVRRLAGVDSTIFYNAVDVSAWQARAQSAAPPSGVRIAFVGRLVPGKGWDDVISACARIRDARPDLDFSGIMLGAGSDLAACRHRIVSEGLSDRVSAPGAADAEGVAEALRGSILVNPTVLSEGFQTTLLEALASGASIVTYPVPGAEVLREQGAPIEIVPRHDVDGLVDAVLRLVDRGWTPFRDDALARWSWSERARSFIDIAAGLRGRRHGNQ